MRIIPDASTECRCSSRARAHRVGDDGDHRRLAGQRGIDKHGYRRERRSQRAVRLAGGDRHGLLSGIHRIASLTKRRLLRPRSASKRPISSGRKRMAGFPGFGSLVTALFLCEDAFDQAIWFL